MVDSSPNNNFAEVATAPSLGKAFSPAGIPLNGSSTLTITLTNNAATVATLGTTGAGTAFVDDFHLLPITVNGTVTTSCTGGTLSNTTNTVTLSGAQIPASNSCTITVPVTGTTAGGPYVNTTGTLYTDKGNASPVTGNLTVYAGSISGRVWQDVGSTNLGTYEAGTDTIFTPGVSIQLWKLVSGSYALQTTVTSDTTNGSYSFPNLAPGTYQVVEPTQPTGTTNGVTTTGTITGSGGGTAGVASNPTATTSQITTIVLGAVAGTGVVDSSPNNNFAEIPAGPATISGYVYADNQSGGTAGIKDAADAPIPGVIMKLTGTDASGPVSKTTTTDNLGYYSFTNLQPSTGAGYTISEVQPQGYIDSVVNAPTGTTLTKPPVVAVGADDTISGVVLAGVTLTNYNFAEKLPPTVGLLPPIVNGYVYLDRNHTRDRFTPGSEPKPGWTVVLYRDGTPICTASTDSSGFYQFDNLYCNGQGVDAGFPDLSAGLIGSATTATGFSIRFSQQGNTMPNYAQSGGNAGNDTAQPGQITNLTLSVNVPVVEQNLPLDPSGIVYDAVTRLPVAGAVVKITGPASFLPTNHLVGGNDTQITGADGMYSFLLQNGFPSGNYFLTVTAPAGYKQGVSTLIPVCVTGAANTILAVQATPTPALIQASNSAPSGANALTCPTTTAVGWTASGALNTQYYLGFSISNADPATVGGPAAFTSAPIVNNHIPLDPIAPGDILMTKVTPLVNVARGDLVPYTITATNTTAASLANISVRDQMPPGFKYRSGSASLNGVKAEPTVAARQLSWSNLSFAAKEKKTFKMILMVGSGVGDGSYTNQTWATPDGSTTLKSNIATATVRIVPDPTFDCPDVIGKVFDDKNANGYQDQGEPGIPNVRLATVRGLLVTTDADGRFHVPCPEIPNQDHGSNFVMKLDDRTLPSGYRLTTENPRDVRITRGKLVKLNFGATIHRVVRIELTDAAFEPGKESLLPDWQQKIEALPRQLTDKPSLIRLAYLQGADVELLNKRVSALREQIEKRWQGLNCCYRLVIETEGEGAQ